MRDIVLPTLNTTDSGAVVQHWHAEDDAVVSAGEPLVEVETSKAVNELEAPCSGFLHRLVEVDAEVAFGERLGIVFETAAERDGFQATAPPAPTTRPAASQPVITKAARELIERHSLDPNQLRGLGKRVIKAADLAPLLSPPKGTTVALTRAQRAVSEVVSEAHRTIPAAFAVLQVSLGAFDALREELRERDDVILGLAEFTIKAIATRHSDHPLFFASPYDEGHVTMAQAPHVGVTVDVGTGLSLPVIRDAHLKTGAEVADLLMELRVQALEKSLRDEDLMGGNITLSLNDDPAVVFAQPIVFPGQVCMLSLGGRQEQARRTPTGFVAEGRVHLGVAYDHRIVNGRNAVEFGRAIKDLLEDQEWLSAIQGTWLGSQQAGPPGRTDGDRSE